MTAMETLLKKADSRTNKNARKKFKPELHRAWDYLSQKLEKYEDEQEIGNKQGTKLKMLTIILV